MKAKFIYYIMFACGLLMGFTSCLDKDPWADWDSVVPVVELPYTNHVLTATKVTPGDVVHFDLLVNYTIADKKNNKEELTVTLGSDESLVDSYNVNNASNYTLLPASCYTMPTVKIAPETRLASTDFQINTSGLDVSNDYILPVVIKSVSPEKIISGNFGVVYIRIQMNR